jgi:hypothetical protein
MELKPRFGIDQLIFGLHQSDLVKLLGEADKVFNNEDDESEIIYQYNELRLQLSFYNQENGRLGYIRCANPEIAYEGKKILGEPVQTVIKETFQEYKNWQIDNYDFFDTYLNVENWVVLNVEYEVVSDIEIGVPYNDDDTYSWPVITKTS